LWQIGSCRLKAGEQSDTQHGNAGNQAHTQLSLKSFPGQRTGGPSILDGGCAQWAKAAI